MTLDYQLQQKDDTWQIYDIVANGVSDLSLQTLKLLGHLQARRPGIVRREILDNIEANAGDIASHPTTTTQQTTPQNNTIKMRQMLTDPTSGRLC